MSGTQISIEEAVEEFIAARDRGEALDPRRFSALHPHLAPDLEFALESLVALDATMQTDDVDRTVPDRVGAYRVVREVGRGGMGIVFEAVEEPLGRRVALKVLPSELVASPSARARFRREAELAARLNHSGVATVFGAGVDRNRPWIAMRFVDGETLSRSIVHARADHVSSVRLSYPPAKERAATLAIADCLAKVARALQSAHEQGVVHRDVKPSNIIVGRDGQPVLVDFGLAITELSDGQSLTRTGDTAGTPAYLAPELVGGEIARPDVQCDVYALGVTLYECLSLVRPFDAPTPIALYRAILSGVAVEVRRINENVSRDLATVVATAMERDRRRRYRNAAALADDLEACVSGRPIAARPVPFTGRVARWAKREPRQALLASALMLSAIGVAVFGGTWWASRDEVRAAERVARDIEREDALLEGFVELQGGSGAYALFARVLAQDPSNLEALAGCALARVFESRRNEALTILANAPHTPGFEALRSLCRREHITGDATQIATRDATTLDLFLIGVSLSIEAKSVALSARAAVQQRALAMLNEAVVRSPRARSFLHIQRAYAALEAGDERVARSSAGALCSLWPDSFQAMCAAGTALVDIDPVSAKPLLERALELDPTAPEPPNELGAACRNLGEFAESERWSWIALTRARRVETYNALGASLIMRGCADEARNAWKCALTIDPRDEQTWLNLGQEASQSGDLDAAEFALEVCLARDPLNPQANGTMGIVSFQRKDWISARNHLEAALASDPARPEYWEYLSWTYVKLRDRPAVLASIAAGLSVAPDDAGLLSLREQMGSQ